MHSQDLSMQFQFLQCIVYLISILIIKSIVLEKKWIHQKRNIINYYILHRLLPIINNSKRKYHKLNLFLNIFKNLKISECSIIIQHLEDEPNPSLLTLKVKLSSDTYGHLVNYLLQKFLLKLIKEYIFLFIFSISTFGRYSVEWTRRNY